MKIISYNVNGIRAALKKGFLDWLQQANPDVICIQEIKAQKNQINPMDFELAGYPHQYWFSAEKKGYSGTAILSKEIPLYVTNDIGIDIHDKVGRVMFAEYENFNLILKNCLIILT